MYHASELCFAGKRAVDMLQISEEKTMTIMQNLGLCTECTSLSQKSLFCNFEASITPLLIF